MTIRAFSIVSSFTTSTHLTSMSIEDSAAAQKALQSFSNQWTVHHEVDYHGTGFLLILGSIDLDLPCFLLNHIDGFVQLTSCYNDSPVFEGAFVTVFQAVAATTRLLALWSRNIAGTRLDRLLPNMPIGSAACAAPGQG